MTEARADFTTSRADPEPQLPRGGGGGGQVTNAADSFSEVQRGEESSPTESGVREVSSGKILNFGIHINIVHSELVLRLKKNTNVYVWTFMEKNVSL